MSSCASNALECDEVVYFCDNVRDLVLAEIGSFRVWMAWMVGGLVEYMLDMVSLAIGSWSPLELTATWVFFGIVSELCCTTPLKVMSLFFSCPPLEVGVGYRTGSATCLSMTGVGCGNTLCASGGKDSTVRQFTKIVWTASIAANYELHMLVGTSLSAFDKKCMEWFILSYAITWGCVIHPCKYSAVSVIINDLVLLPISWMQR